MSSITVIQKNEKSTKSTTRKKKILNYNKFKKYLKTTTDFLRKENENKNKILIEQQKANYKLKTELSQILEKMNSIPKDQQNSENNNLNDDAKNKNLEMILNIRKNDYSLIKKFNTSVKDQYFAMQKKMKDLTENMQVIDIISNERLNIEKLQNENKKIQKEIYINESQKIKQQKKILNINYDNTNKIQLDNYNDKLNKYLFLKNNYILKINQNKNRIKENKNELTKLKKIISDHKNIINKNTNISMKINEEFNKIDCALHGSVEEIIEKCINNQNFFSDNNNKSLNESNIKNNESINLNKSNSTTILSPDTSSINFPQIYKNRNKIYKRNIDSKPESFLTEKILSNNNSAVNIKVNKIQKEKIIENNKLINKFKKIKLKPNKITHMSLDFSEKKKNIININNLNNLDYNKINDDDYWKLLNKKQNYVIEKERIEVIIKEMQKSFKNKYNKLLNDINENNSMLNEMKNENTQLKEEVEILKNNLEKLINEKNDLNQKKEQERPNNQNNQDNGSVENVICNGGNIIGS